MPSHLPPSHTLRWDALWLYVPRRCRLQRSLGGEDRGWDADAADSRLVRDRSPRRGSGCANTEKRRTATVENLCHARSACRHCESRITLTPASHRRVKSRAKEYQEWMCIQSVRRSRDRSDRPNSARETLRRWADSGLCMACRSMQRPLSAAILSVHAQRPHTACPAIAVAVWGRCVRRWPVSPATAGLGAAS